MGLYPPTNITLSQGEMNSLKSNKGMPSLRVRNKEGSMRAVIDGYTMIPVFSYLPNSKWDDIN